MEISVLRMHRVNGNSRVKAFADVVLDNALMVKGIMLIESRNGPFVCMPNRLAEAILSETMTARDKLATDPADPALRAVLADIDDLPFLAIETDGAPFPQLIAAKLDAFLLRAGRIHERMRAAAGR